MKRKQLHNQFIVPSDKRLRLSGQDPKFTGEFENEESAQSSIQEITENLAKYQDMLFAHEEHAVVMIFQGMDAAGKDEAIQDVLSHVDPQGCKATKFATPTSKELKHDYLRRFLTAMPESGQIGIFNRSYYEQLVGERIYPERVQQWHLQPKAKGNKLWRQRFQEVNNIEQYLSDNGVVVLKFFLHVSKEQQLERLLERARLPEKKWQLSMSDLNDRQRWDEFMTVYEEALHYTNTKAAPWHIIPADHRWFAHLTIASVIVATLKSLHSGYPTLDEEEQKELKKAQQILEKEAKSAGD